MGRSDFHFCCTSIDTMEYRKENENGSHDGARSAASAVESMDSQSTVSDPQVIS
jgi:hypothetical protein